MEYCPIEGVKAAGAFGWRPTTLVVPKRQEIRGLNYPEPLGPSRSVAGHLYFTLLKTVLDFKLWPCCECYILSFE